VAKKTNRSRQKARKARLSATQMMRPGKDHAPGAEEDAGPSQPAELQAESKHIASDIRRALVLAVLVLTAVVIAVLALT
jgi:hypothetical protein